MFLSFKFSSSSSFVHLNHMKLIRKTTWTRRQKVSLIETPISLIWEANLPHGHHKIITCMRICLCYKIIYGLVDVELPYAVCCAPYETPQELKSPCLTTRFILQWIITNTHSLLLQSCNGTGCHQTLHYNPHLIPSKLRAVCTVTIPQMPGCCFYPFAFHCQSISDF